MVTKVKPHWSDSMLAPIQEERRLAIKKRFEEAEQAGVEIHTRPPFLKILLIALVIVL